MPKRKVTEPTGILADRQTSDGRRRIKLTAKEKQLARRVRLAESAAVMFLDIDSSYTYTSIARELEISIHSLKELIKSGEFDKAYNDLMPEVGHDPRYRAARTAIGDMLPVAVRGLKDILDSGNTAAGVRLRAIEKVLELNGLEEPTIQSDRNEIVEFLLANKIDVGQVNITIPPEYIEALQPTVDAEFTMLPDGD